MIGVEQIVSWVRDNLNDITSAERGLGLFNAEQRVAKMKSLWFGTVALAASLIFTTGGVQAADCDAGKGGGELTGEEAQAVYECLKDSLQAGYAEGDKRWIPAAFVTDYSGWTAASKFPAAPGFHGSRFLVTYVNETGADAYLSYGEDAIPAGTVIAKESFSVNDDGKAAPGPLFIMEKVAEGTSPQTMDWYYMMVSPSGAPQAVNVYTACNECHVKTFGSQQGLGYPVPEARVQ